MGERREVGGRAGRPPVGPGPETVAADVLRAALLPGHLDPEAETRAVAAFRDASKERQGAQRLRTRRRDDWRPRARRGTARSLRTLLGVLLGGVTLGGVAVAAIGELPHHTAPHRPAPSVAPASPGPHAHPSGTDTTGVTLEPNHTGKTSQKPGKSGKKAADKANKADKADKAAKKADKAAAKAAEKSAKAGRKAAKVTGKAAKSTAKAAKATGRPAQGKKK
jgi:hypothetical protein